MHLPRFLLPLAVTILPASAGIVTPTTDSIVVQNPSFQAQDFPGFPGYLNSNGNPGDITGWNAAGGAGINGADIGAGAPFANNGAFPDNTRVAFIQGAGSLSQGLDGFEPGSLYWVQVFLNSRNGGFDTPVATVTLGLDTVLPPTPILPVGEQNPYRFFNLPWNASSSFATLSIGSSAQNGGDAALTLDGISVTRRTTQDVVIANPSFEASGVSFGFPGYIPNPFTVAGWTRTTNGDANVLINGSNQSGNPFTDNGVVPEGRSVLGLQNNARLSQVLNGLSAGGLYRLTLDYNARIGDDPTALITIDGETALNTAVAEVGGTNPYYRLAFDFTADGTSTTLQLENARLGGDSTLLIDNIRVVAVPEPATAGLTLLGVALLGLRRRRANA